MTRKTKVAVVGSGNIGTDLMVKIARLSSVLEMAALVGIDPHSAGLARARKLGIPTTDAGVAGLLAMPAFDEVEIVFDATCARAHRQHDEVLRNRGKRLIDLTPAAVGPYTVPAVNAEANLEQANLNMVTCGGQATIPIVAAIARIGKIRYAEIIASIASRSAGPGTRANIDEFTETTARAIEAVGGAARGKAVIILNPAEPPLIMRDTIYCLVESGEPSAIEESIRSMIRTVQDYVPGYRLKQDVRIEHIARSAPLRIPGEDPPFVGMKVSVFIEVEGAAHYLPAYAGNLDIMTSAALRTAERIALREQGRRAA